MVHVIGEGKIVWSGPKVIVMVSFVVEIAYVVSFRSWSASTKA